MPAGWICIIHVDGLTSCMLHVFVAAHIYTYIDAAVVGRLML